MRDILESSIIVGGFLLLVFLFGGFITYVSFVADNIRIQKNEWKCSKAIIIDDDPSKTE